MKQEGTRRRRRIGDGDLPTSFSLSLHGERFPGHPLLRFLSSHAAPAINNSSADDGWDEVYRTAKSV